jgi:hypothetical protein
MILYWSAIACWSAMKIPFCWGYCVVERQQADALHEVDVSLPHHFNHV